MADQVLANQTKILANQSKILANQGKLDSNQSKILANQTKILANQKKILVQVPLASAPDYVRYVAATKEVWVTEPGKSRIEIFALSNARPSHVGFIDVPGGPESLAIDEKRGRACDHRVFLDRSSIHGRRWNLAIASPRMTTKR